MLVSEIGSMSLELTRLSQLTHDDRYYDAIQRIADEFEKSQGETKLPGMWPIVVNPAIPDFTGDNIFTLGGMSDSLYEYLPKQYLMLGGLLEQPKKMYETFIEVAKKHLFFKALNPENLDLLFSGDVKVNLAINHVDLTPRGQHLSCFVGGMVALGARIFSRPEELKTAEELTNGCVWSYDVMPNNVGPEIFTAIPCDPSDDCKWSEAKWTEAVYTSIRGKAQTGTREERVRRSIDENRLVPGLTSIEDRRYILRPEAIESVFIMYRVTGAKEWQDKAWRMFQAVEAVTKTDIASSAIDDVTAEKPAFTDSMESFWLAETLKYYYLIFEDPTVMSLDEFVLNTEAHPLRRPGM
jgi:mannosyl-oligosaccharide alpha-1,2-mannosidase